MSRLRYAGLTGTVGSGNMTNSATSHTFTAALTYGAGATVPTLAGADYFMLSILDTSGNLSEVVKVTAYNSGTKAATIARAQEGTTGVAHTSGDAVTLAAYPTDFPWTGTLSSALNSTTNPSLTGWTAGTGTWTAETDRFRLNSSATTSAMRLFYNTKVPFSATDVQIDIRIDASNASASSRAGIVFGTPATDAGGGLLIALATTGSTTVTNTVHTEIDAVANLKDFTLGATIAHSTWMTLRVIQVGAFIDVYLNGTLIWSAGLLGTSAGGTISPIDMRRFALVGFGVDASFRNLTYNSLTLA